MKYGNIIPNKQLRIAVGLSGGVDSSVAALLLKKEGYHVIGITMVIFDDEVSVKQSDRHACYGPGEKADVEAIKSVCKRLDIPLYIIDLKKEYREYVINYVRNEYLLGRTPNPCVVCNKKMKFDFLLEKSKEAEIDFKAFATGHYARIEKSGRRYLLRKALDRSKDQTYFLYTLTSEKLSHTMFPLGVYTKSQVRAIARSFELETANRSESQDFIEGGDYSSLFTKGETMEGDIVDEIGNVLGKHRGIVHYTIGQRRGLGISSLQPLYVVKIDVKNNRLVVGKRNSLFSKSLIAKDIHLLAPEILTQPSRVKAKIRLSHREADATVFPHEMDKIKVHFDEPQMSMTPGQSVVFYSKDIVLGGGIIEQVL
jgi:tRNA-specific 2-thiouridylase